MKNTFEVIYSFFAKNIKEAKKIAFDICIEQSVEFPYEFIKDKYIKQDIVGKIISITKKNKKYYVKIAYNNQIAGNEFTQFLNVLFGNTSLKPGIKLENFELSDFFYNFFKGPKFGIDGIRKILNVYDRPLTCSALKPMGLKPEKLAELAGKFASGGIDIIKDDHGLANQSFSPFKKRVKLVCKTIKKNLLFLKHKTIYTPNITADSESEIFNRAFYAKKCGAGGVVISGFLTGLSTVKKLSENPEFNLPILLHPSFSGSFVVNPKSGISHFALFGKLSRIAGADIVIFPNYESRFSFTENDCKEIILGCKIKMKNIKPVFPGPGGGISINSISKLIKFYGKDVVFLIGGGLFNYSTDIIKSCQKFKSLIS